MPKCVMHLVQNNNGTAIRNASTDKNWLVLLLAAVLAGVDDDVWFTRFNHSRIEC